MIKNKVPISVSPHPITSTEAPGSGKPFLVLRQTGYT